MCEGTVRVRLRDPSGPDAESDGPREDHRSLARGRLGRGDRYRRPPDAGDRGNGTAPGAIGAITSSRCTNEEVYVVQKMVRAAFGNNNVDTCARVCHSPTGYGLKQTFGESAGTQDFQSVAQADVIMVIGANPTDGHPVFASRMKQRLRQGARLIVADPRRIDLVRSPHIEADHHLQLQAGNQRCGRQCDGARGGDCLALIDAARVGRRRCRRDDCRAPKFAPSFEKRQTRTDRAGTRFC